MSATPTTAEKLTAAAEEFERQAPSDEEARILRDIVVQIGLESRFALSGPACRVGNLLSARSAAFARDGALQRALAFLGWVSNDAVTSIAAGKRGLAIEPENPRVYLQLGWAFLTAGQPVDAFLALSAGLSFAPEDGGLQSYRRLALSLTKGIDQVDLSVDGQTYRFSLSCFSGQAMEAAVHHLHGILYELEELRHVREAVGGARVVVEVGTLVGNHTVFFARNLRPERIYCFDVDPNSIRQTTENLRLNVPDEQNLELIVVEKAVGDRTGFLEVGSRRTELTTLSSEINEPVDFIKIDVDGMEMQVLEGARSLFADRRPRALIEVSNENAPAFARFLEEIGYVVERKFERPADTNYFVVPRP